MVYAFFSCQWLHPMIFGFILKTRDPSRECGREKKVDFGGVGFHFVRSRSKEMCGKTGDTRDNVSCTHKAYR